MRLQHSVFAEQSEANNQGSRVYILENEKFFELKSKEYRDGIKEKRQDRDGV